MPNKSSSSGGSYLKYAGLAFQIVFTIMALAYGGMKLDEYVGNEKPWYTLGLSVFGVIGTMVYLIKRVASDK